MTAQVNETTTVRDLVGRFRQTRQVFEQYGIDYCCGGGQNLAAAAKTRGREFQALATALKQAIESPPSTADQADKDWYAEPLASLIDHIVRTHHAYLNQALPRLRKLVATVWNAHRARHGAMLQELLRLFTSLDEELTSHLMKEERMLFPYIVASEEAARKGTAPPFPPFGTVGNPIRQMEHEHESAGGVLQKFRQATGDYKLPADACPTFTTLYEELQHLEADLHQHIHLENNILFPRAIRTESAPPAGSLNFGSAVPT